MLLNLTMQTREKELQFPDRFFIFIDYTGIVVSFKRESRDGKLFAVSIKRGQLTACFALRIAYYRFNYSCSIRSRNSCSVKTGTPSCCALVSLLPASFPATTNAVFLETDDDALPPSLTIKSSIS